MGVNDIIIVLFPILVISAFIGSVWWAHDNYIEQADTDYINGCVDVDEYYDNDIYKDEIDKLILKDNARGNNVTLKDVICKEV